MKRYYAVFSSDQVSKDGTRFTVSALEDGVWQASIYGIPAHMSHDMHRPIGWSYPKGLLFEPKKTLTVGYFLIADEKSDYEGLQSARENFFINHLHRHINPFKEKFISALGQLYNEEKFKWYYNGIVLVHSNEILRKAFPTLVIAADNDRDGLIPLNKILDDFQYLGQGVFKSKTSELAVLAHPYFRKSLSIHNNFHSIFLDELIALKREKDVEIKIRLDLDFLGYAPSYITSFEFEFWWGPKYDDDIANIEPGLTVYKSDEFEQLYYNIDRSEFYWKINANLREFECEEIKDQVAPMLTDSYCCRYVHSIYNVDKLSFEHFDGAIRSYSTELMIERLDAKMTEFGRRSQYLKLFRVDGKLMLEKWKSLVTNYFQGNPQIYEYFGLEKSPIKQLEPEDRNLTPLEKYIPYSITQGDGIRLYATYNKQSPGLLHKRYVSILDQITLEDGQYDAVEFFVVELKKALNRLNDDLVIPDCKFICPEDFYTNIPCVFHSSDDTQQLVNNSITALKNIVTSLVSRSNEEILSFTLAWNIEDKEFRLSVIGHVSDLLTWFNSFAILPTDRTELKKWLNDQGKFLQSNGAETETPILSEVIQSDGVLYFKRRNILRDVEFEIIQHDDNLGYQIHADETKSDLIHSLSKKELFITPSFLVEEMICSKSLQNYLNSPYSMVLDDGVGQYMKKFRIANYHWTDKPRPIQFK